MFTIHLPNIVTLFLDIVNFFFGISVYSVNTTSIAFPSILDGEDPSSIALPDITSFFSQLKGDFREFFLIRTEGLRIEGFECVHMLIIFSYWLYSI